MDRGAGKLEVGRRDPNGANQRQLLIRASDWCSISTNHSVPTCIVPLSNMRWTHLTHVCGHQGILFLQIYVSITPHQGYLLLYRQQKLVPSSFQLHQLGLPLSRDLSSFPIQYHLPLQPTPKPNAAPTNACASATPWHFEHRLPS